MQRYCYEVARLKTAYLSPVDEPSYLQNIEVQINPRYFIAFVCAQHERKVSKDTYYSRGCKSLTGELVKPVSKSQGGLSRDMH